jgi:hypothetical protein
VVRQEVCVIQFEWGREIAIFNEFMIRNDHILHFVELLDHPLLALIDR